MSFGTRLKNRREELNLKQSELGLRLGITGAAIGNYENEVSSPKADILYRIFDALKCDANYLFQDEMGDLESDKFTPHETTVINAYRAKPEMQAAVNTLLGITPEEEQIHTIHLVASDGDNKNLKLTHKQFVEAEQLLKNVKRRK